MTSNENGKKSSASPGLAILGLLVVGIEAIVMSIVAAMYMNFVGSGVCVIGGALSFGILAYISFR